MAQGDLSTLAKVKEWLGIASGVTTSDPLLGRLLTSASRFVTNECNRSSFVSAPYTERCNGNDHDTLLLRNGPVTSVSQILMDGKTITTQATGNPPAGGYLIDDRFTSVGCIVLPNDVFPRGRLNVQVSYRAGFMATEASTAAASVTPSQTWLSDAGVTFANGSPLTLVTGSPATSQYSVNTAGVYAFAASDFGFSILISYGYPPADLEGLVVELVGERFKYMSRIGMSMQTLGGQETTSYSQKDVSAYQRTVLQNFACVTPLD